MRKCLWMLALLIGLVVTPRAHADSYADASFTCDSSCVDVPTDPLVTFPGPTIPVSFYGQGFDITLDSSDKGTDTYTWGIDTKGSSWDFVITDTTNGKSDYSPWFADGSHGKPYGSGSVCFTPPPPCVSTPEPSSGGLLLLGVGLALLAWRFVGRSSHLQAA